MIHRALLHKPGDDTRPGLGFPRTTGFADGRQRPPSPGRRTPLLQRAPEATLRGTDAIPVAGLPCAAAPLTVSQPPRRLAVPMKRLGAWPAMAIHHHQTNDCPPQTIAPPGFPRLLLVSLTPQQAAPHRRPAGRHPPLRAAIPIRPSPYAYGLLRGPRQLARHGLALLRPTRLPPPCGAASARPPTRAACSGGGCALEPWCQSDPT